MKSIKKYIYNILGSGVPLVANFIATPLLINKYGLEVFGEINLLMILSFYCLLLDFGVSKFLATRYAGIKNEGPENSGLVAQAFLYVFCVWIIFISPVFFLGIYFNWIDSSKLNEYYVLLGLVLAVVSVAFSIVSGVLEGLNNFGRVNLAQVFYGVSFPLGLICCAYFLDYSIIIIFILMIVSRFLPLCWLIYIIRAEIKLPFKKLKINDILLIWKNSQGVAISSFVSPILDVADRIIISFVFGNRVLSYYSVPYSIVEKLRIIPAAVSRIIFVEMFKANGEINLNKINNSLKIVVIASCLIVIPAQFIISDFLSLWIGSKFSNDTGFLPNIILLGMLVGAPSAVFLSCLQASGKANVAAKIHAAQLIPYICLLFVSFKYFGLYIGMLVWLARIFIDLLLLYSSLKVIIIKNKYFYQAFFLLVAVMALVYFSSESLMLRLLFAILFFIGFFIALKNSILNLLNGQ